MRDSKPSFLIVGGTRNGIVKPPRRRFRDEETAADIERREKARTKQLRAYREQAALYARDVDAFLDHAMWDGRP